MAEKPVERTWPLPDPVPFEVRVDPEQRCLYITMRGHWTRAIFNSYAAVIAAAEGEMRRFEGTTYTLVDGRNFPLQDVDIAERFVPLTASLHIQESRRTALVVPRAADRAQARGAAVLVNARYFREMDSAREWLFSDEA